MLPAVLQGRTMPRGGTVGMSRAGLAGAIVAIGVLAYLIIQSFQLEAAVCQVCMSYNGREQCREVGGSNEKEGARGRDHQRVRVPVERGNRQHGLPAPKAEIGSCRERAQQGGQSSATDCPTAAFSVMSASVAETVLLESTSQTHA
jgi:hypothetical protein